MYAASPPPPTCMIGALQQSCEEELKRCYCIRLDSSTPGRYMFTQNSNCCPKPGAYNWACASLASGNITQSGCSTYGVAASGSDALTRCNGVTNMIIQRKPGANGLSFYMQDGQVKGNDNSTAAQCGSPSGTCGKGGVGSAANHVSTCFCMLLCSTSLACPAQAYSSSGRSIRSRQRHAFVHVVAGVKNTAWTSLHFLFSVVTPALGP